MNPKEAYDVIAPCIQDAGSFYGEDPSLAVGVGQVFSGVRFPVYDEDKAVFKTVRGLVYVFTHECDISQENERPFNDDVAIVPLVPFENFVEHFLPSVVAPKQAGFLHNLANYRVSRMMYFPPHPSFGFGGVIFLNQIASTKLHAFNFEGVTRVAVLSAIGRRRVDYVFENHFLRPTQHSPLWRSMQG